MTGKERMNAIIRGGKADRFSWTTISDNVTRQNMPEELRGISIIDFYRHIGCDVLQFGNYGLKPEERITYPFRYVYEGTEKSTGVLPDGKIKEISRAKGGELTAILSKGHPVKHPVETREDLFILLDIWCNADVAEVAAGDRYPVVDKIGDAGIFAPTLRPSPVQQLLEYDMGVENFYYFLSDYPEEMDRLISEMRRCRLKEYEYAARNLPFEIIIPVENTSTMMISPSVYREYSMEHIRDFTEIMHRYGKKSVVHMCGHVGQLLDEIKEIGLDGIHALTEPPVGDCLFDKALDVLGEDLIILGTFDSTVLHSASATAKDIKRELDRLMTPRLRNSRFILNVASDGIPTDLWKFEAIREWADKNNY